MVENFPRLLLFLIQKLFHDAFEEREIAVYLHRQPKIRKARSSAEKRRDRSDRVRKILRIRVLKSKISGFWQWIDADDFSASLFCAFQRSQHARMVRSRILTDNEDRVGLQEVVQGNGSFADTNRLCQSRAARFVAHI